MACIGVGFSKHLSNARVMSAFVNGRDVVVWRSRSENCLRGKIAARIEACVCLTDLFAEKPSSMYHGWHYGADGKCKYIPAHPDLEPPETIQIQRHLLRKAGVIWYLTGVSRIRLKFQPGFSQYVL